jgi:Type I phosphodiesterase / nucleotide pyrophosphatase
MTDARAPGAPKKLILAVVDGLGPDLLDRAIAAGRAPAIAQLAAAGERRDDCVSTFPSLTPVCLSALLTGEHPAGSHIPGMSWYHRGERRLVEYGSSFSATLAEGTRQMVDDILVNLNLVHLSPRATTIFEALEDAGLVTAGVNTYVCRGRVRHPITRPMARRFARRVGIVDAVYGPRRYFLGDLFFSDLTGAPRNFGGGIDRHASAVGRWLVTRDGFDFMFFYLYETDAAQHRAGDVLGAVEGADRGMGLLVEAAGGLDRFLDRYAVVVVADHSQSAVLQAVEAAAPLEGAALFRSSRRSDPADCELAVTASNRVAMVYRLERAREPAARIAGRMLESPAAELAMFAQDGWLVVRRGGGELRFRRGPGDADARGNRFTVAGDADLLHPQLHPNALERIEGALLCPNAGEVIVSAAPGYEYADSGGAHHAGGGSHGSLRAEDSIVPLITAGFEQRPGLGGQPSITDLAPLAERHFGVPGPARQAASALAGVR